MTAGLAFELLFRLKRRKFAQGAKPAEGSIKTSLLAEQSLPKPSLLECPADSAIRDP
jgi:hypothetical protein